MQGIDVPFGAAMVVLAVAVVAAARWMADHPNLSPRILVTIRSAAAVGLLICVIGAFVPIIDAPGQLSSYLLAWGAGVLGIGYAMLVYKTCRPGTAIGVPSASARSE